MRARARTHAATKAEQSRAYIIKVVPTSERVLAAQEGIMPLCATGLEADDHIRGQVEESNGHGVEEDLLDHRVVEEGESR